MKSLVLSFALLCFGMLVGTQVQAQCSAAKTQKTSCVQSDTKAAATSWVSPKAVLVSTTTAKSDANCQPANCVNKTASCNPAQCQPNPNCNPANCTGKGKAASNTKAPSTSDTALAAKQPEQKEQQ